MKDYVMVPLLKDYDLTDSLDDETRFKKLGSITVRDAGYIVDDRGKLSCRVSTTEPAWLSKLNFSNDSIRSLKQGIVFVTDNDIHQSDRFNIYSPIDPDITSRLDRGFNDGNDDKVFLIWGLEGRLYGSNKAPDRPLVSLTDVPVDCPVCGRALETCDSPLDKFELACTNQQCPAFVTRDVVRYLSIAGRIDGYDRLVSYMSRRYIIHNSVHLYDDRVRDLAYQQCGGTELIEQFWDDIDRTIGHVKLSDWLQALPLTRAYNVVRDISERTGSMYYICTDTINRDFQEDPVEFLNYLDRLYDYIDIEDEGILCTHRDEIEKYMSMPMVAELSNTLFDGKNYDSQLVDLCRIGVFSKSP